MADYLNIAGRVRTTASDGVGIEAQEVKDLNLNKSQQEINADVQTELGDRYTKEETYSKEQLNNLITTPDVNYVSVVATNATTAVTDVLPATGQANTIYRVGNWNGTQYDPTMYALYAWNGSAYVCLAVRSFVGEVYDVSVNHPDGQGNPTAYADLTAALGTDGANIPADIRRGGMSIKYVLSSDNKYVQYRLMADDWSINTEDWAVAEEGVYVDNPEFVYVKTDAENKILWAIKIDGGIYYGAGVPQQAIDYINERIAELPLDEYEDIVAFLNNLEKEDKTLQTLLNEKVDKEEGKSLIDAEYASSQSTIDNPEYLHVTTDSEDKILEGISTNGTKEVNLPVNLNAGEVSIDDVEVSTVNNPEYLAVEIDAKGKVLSSTKADGSHYISNIESETLDAINAAKLDKEEGKVLVDSEVAETLSLTENPEYIEVKTDSEGKLLAGRTLDGAAFENVGFITPKASIDGTTIENVEDPEERISIVTDNLGKVVSSRDSNGGLHEDSITTHTINGDSIKTEQAVVDNVEITNAVIENLNVKVVESEQINTKNLTANNIISDSFYDAPDLPRFGYVNIKSEDFFLEAYTGVSSIDDVVPIRVYDDTDANADNRMSRSFYYVKNTLTDNGDGSYSINASSKRLMFFAFAKAKYNEEAGKYYAKATVRKINGVCYYADTLGFASRFTERVVVINGYSVEAADDATLAEGGTKTVNVEVVPMTGSPCIEAWTVEDFDYHAIAGTDIGKKYAHRCIADFDFGDYYTKQNVPVEIKYQGNSTMSFKKRGLRVTFYKNSSYAKKDKIKIGEMVRLSGFNMKAESKPRAIKCSFLYRLFVDIWNSRPITDRYDWDNDINGYFHGATGIIKDFPIRLSIDNNFYGLYFFGLKKDEKNYMLDGEDSSGLLVCSSLYTWGASNPSFNAASGYDEEMLDEMSVSTANALNTWYHFINNRLFKGSDDNEYNINELTDVDGVMYVTSSLNEGAVVESSISASLIEFNKQNAYERLDVLGFIDYFIGLQVFTMADNFNSNMMVYSNANKKKMFPFFYDLDNTVGGSTGDYIAWMRNERPDVVTFWDDFADIYWDDIVNRYRSLRKKILNIQHLNYVYKELDNNIPETVYQEENAKWRFDYIIKEVRGGFGNVITYLDNRLNWLDTNYFI